MRVINISKNVLEKKLSSVPEIEPDEIDLAMLAEAETENDGELFTKADIIAACNYNGVLSIRIPKELHRIIAINAEENGTSINQYVIYCLTKTNAGVSL